jgi:dinuclear metal center YbgI/SA1388 family protein
MTVVKTIVSFLDRALNVAAFTDRSNNGLQVENSGRTGTVCCGVDASMAFFEAAAARGAGLCICHHGLSWEDSLKHITGLNYRRLAFLIRRDVALYAAHLPLDAHARYGNNAQIARVLGLRRRKPFGRHRGVDLGFEGVLPRPMRYGRFLDLVRRNVGGALRTMDFGPKTVRRVAVVSGGAAGDVAEAGEKGIDVFLSGEPTLEAWHLAQEHGVNAVFAGHYATETFGVRALVPLLKRRFRCKTEFIAQDVPY